eukprot:6331398-Ditylum_brightwellii.AAC.1
MERKRSLLLSLKYANRESCHRTEVFKTIPAGVLTCMGRLTSITHENKDMPITSLYPTHTDALKKANLLPKRFPTMRELYEQELEWKEKQKLKDAEKEKRKDE